MICPSGIQQNRRVMQEHKGRPKEQLKAHERKVNLEMVPYIFPTQGGFAVFTVDIRHGV